MIALLAVASSDAPPSCAGEAQGTMAVSAQVLGMSEVDSQIDSLTTHGLDPSHNTCTAVVVRCTTTSPVRVTVEDRRGNARPIATSCASLSGAAQPVHSCVAPPAGSGLRISIEY
jgi:hypothetical protein